MKFTLFLTISIGISSFFGDIVTWLQYDNKSFYNVSTDVTTDYQNDEVTIMSNNNFNIFVFNSQTFKVSTDKPNNKTFYMNANFFNKDGENIGLVVVNGKRESSRVRGGGYLYTLNGKTTVSSKTCPYYTDYSAQSILWAIDNGVINHRLLNQNHANQLTYRTLIGQNKEGDIIIVASKDGGIVTIRDIVNMATDLNVIEAILFDGGTSVDYEFDNGEFSVGFNSLSNFSKFLMGIDSPSSYIYLD